MKAVERYPPWNPLSLLIQCTQRRPKNRCREPFSSNSLRLPYWLSRIWRLVSPRFCSQNLEDVDINATNAGAIYLLHLIIAAISVVATLRVQLNSYLLALKVITLWSSKDFQLLLAYIIVYLSDLLALSVKTCNTTLKSCSRFIVKDENESIFTDNVDSYM